MYWTQGLAVTHDLLIVQVVADAGQNCALSTLHWLLTSEAVTWELSQLRKWWLVSRLVAGLAGQLLPPLGVVQHDGLQHIAAHSAADAHQWQVVVGADVLLEVSNWQAELSVCEAVCVD